MIINPYFVRTGDGQAAPWSVYRESETAPRVLLSPDVTGFTFGLYGGRGLSYVGQTVTLQSGTYEVAVTYWSRYQSCWPAGPNLSVTVGSDRPIDFQAPTAPPYPYIVTVKGTVTVVTGTYSVRVRLFSGPADDLCQGGVRVEYVSLVKL